MILCVCTQIKVRRDAWASSNFRKNYDQPKEIKHTNAATSGILEKYSYEYDLNGNIDKEVYYQSYGGGSTLTKEFWYDSLNRLSRMDYEDDRADYTYDKVGNKIKETYFDREGSYYIDLYKLLLTK